MKSRIVTALLSLAAAVWLTAVVFGQTAPIPMFSIGVPFDFVAGGITLPAGQYTVSHMMNSDWILLTHSDGDPVASVQVLESSAPINQSATKLVFNRYGERYFLSQIWTAKDHQVHDCIKSSAEKELASRNGTATQVAVAKYKAE